MVGVEVNVFGKTKTILSRQVLVVRQKNGIDVGQATSDLAKNKVQMALKFVPVEGCKKTRYGGLL